jgi:hypothetical protein
MTDAQKIEALKANLGNLDDKGRKFADSLIGYWDKRGTLSSKQWYWVTKLSEATEEPKAKRKAKAPKAKPDPRFEAMLQAFRSANTGNRKRILRSLHPDQWENADWATELFQAANK